MKNVKDITQIPYSNNNALHEHERPFSVVQPIWFDCLKKEWYSKNKVHYHDIYEFLIIRGRAEGNVFCDNNVYSFGDHQVFVFPPGRLHSFEILSNEGDVVVIQFSAIAAEKIFNSMEFLSLYGLTPNQLNTVSESYNTVSEIFLQISLSASDDPKNIYRDIVNVFTFLANDTVSKKEPELSDPFISKVIEWTTANFRQKKTVSDIALALGLSNAYFCRRFKKKTGSTWLNYLNSLRLTEATKLLQNGATVTDASYSSGFNEISYFIRLFRRARGVTPKQFSKQEILVLNKAKKALKINRH